MDQSSQLARVLREEQMRGRETMEVMRERQREVDRGRDNEREERKSGREGRENQRMSKRNLCLEFLRFHHNNEIKGIQVQVMVRGARGWEGEKMRASERVRDRYCDLHEPTPR